MWVHVVYGQAAQKSVEQQLPPATNKSEGVLSPQSAEKGYEVQAANAAGNVTKGERTAEVPVTASGTVPKDWAEVAVRLVAIEKAVEKRDSSSVWTVLMTAIAGLIGVIVGGVINARIQNRALANTKQIADDAVANAKSLADAKAKQDRDLAESRVRLDIESSFVQWELKQMSELYGPLHALFGESNALYRQMNEVLWKSDPKQFRFEEGADFDKREFQIAVDGQWVRFRTVLHLGEVYGRGFGIEDYFDEVVAIGERIQKIIAEKAGFARPDEPELLTVFGKYLAHYAVLKRVHSEMKKRVEAGRSAEIEKTSVPMKVQESAVFPNEIDGCIKRGFDAISKDLMEWRNSAPRQYAPA